VTALNAVLDGHLDPHWLWAHKTGFAGYLLKGDGRVRCVVELSPDAIVNARQRKAFLDLVHAHRATIEIPRLHEQRLSSPDCTHFVARLAIDEINSGTFAAISQRIKPVFVGAGEHRRGGQPPPSKPGPLNDKDMVSQLEVGNTDHVRGRIVDWLRAAPLAFAHVVDAIAPVSPMQWPVSLPGTGDRFLGGRVPPGPDHVAFEFASEAPAAVPVVMGVIDFGCPFAHEHFADDESLSAPGTRIKYFWDQGRVAHWCDRTTGAPQAPEVWITPQDFDYGREADAPRLAALMKHWLGQSSPVYRKTFERHDPLFEQACYACAGVPELLDRQTHGAHVLDIAAGCGFTPCGSAPLHNDAAASAPIVFVQLPDLAVSDLSGGWLDTYVIDAVHYILDRARSIDAHARVVINLSFGSYAGPHDGSSLLERALDDVARSNGAIVVLAAGNLPANDQPVHAQGQLGAGKTASIQWHIPSNDGTQSFCELWADAQGARPRLQVTLQPPNVAGLNPGVAGLTVSDKGAQGQAPERGWRKDADRSMVALCHPILDGRSVMALLAVGPTRRLDQDTSAAQPADPGHWTITLENQGKEEVQVHLWTERDEPWRGDAYAVAQSHLSEQPGGAIQTTATHTLTAQASGAHTLVVGGAVVDDAAGWREMYAPSACGPSRDGVREGPDIVAAAERLAGDPRGQTSELHRQGVTAAGNLSSTTVDMDGTSMAAPWLARKVAGLLASGQAQDRTSVRAALIALTSGRPNQRDDRLKGLGSLLPNGQFMLARP
jgi:subtilisin family serine protease